MITANYQELNLDTIAEERQKMYSEDGKNQFKLPSKDDTELA